MMPQMFPSSSSLPLNQVELQHELERLFGEVERMLESTLSPQPDSLPPADHWAYLPIGAEASREESLL